MGMLSSMPHTPHSQVQNRSETNTAGVFMCAILPVSQVVIKMPTKVEIASVGEYASKLEAAGKPVTLLVDPGEGHNPRKPLIRLAYVNLLERMLHTYLGAGEPEPCVPELCRYLEQTVKVNKALR